MRNTSDQAWTIFERNDPKEIYCAVPQGNPVPRFVLSGNWRYAGASEDGGLRPRGFNRTLAAFAAGLNGYYVFTSFNSEGSRHK